MRSFEIDVSGGDLLSKNYVICVADKNGLIKGFKFSDNIVKTLSSRYGQGFYNYAKSKKGKSFFKIRIYCVVIYYIFKSLKINEEISLDICRDFIGRENDIKNTLLRFLEKELGLNVGDRIYFVKLSSDSNADRYSYLMRHDTKNKMNTYVKISIEEIEKWLKK